MPVSQVLLGITMWLAWTVRPGQDGSEQFSPDRAAPLSIVSIRRLMSIGPRLEAKTGTEAAAGVHELVRFNVCNFGDESVTLCAIALKSLSGETLGCELVPSVVIAPGARYPLMAEVTVPVAEGVDIQVDHFAGQRLWVSAHMLPRDR